MTLSSLLIYVIFVDPYQGRTMMLLCLLSFPTSKAYVELIGVETVHTYLQSIYCNVKQWIQRNDSYNQIKMCMCVDVCGGNGYIWCIWW
jgi:hypothetical protein